ncbi:hypothetical protein HK099_001808, partial [Clydaea vesicula]
MASLSKGNPVNIPELGFGYLYGNVNELGNVSRGPGKSYLFFLTNYHPEIGLSRDRVKCWEKRSNFVVSGALLMILENPRERIIFKPSRTHNRSRSPRLTAS